MPGESERTFLILSDGKPGHVNQSIALARHLGRPFEIVGVHFRNRPFKLLSYLLDRVGVYTPSLLCWDPPEGNFCAVVSAGSETYYANKVLARRLGVPSVAIMLPRGYRLDFDRDRFRQALDAVFACFPDFRIVVTTSRRTPADILVQRH